MRERRGDSRRLEVCPAGHPGRDYVEQDPDCPTDGQGSGPWWLVLFLACSFPGASLTPPQLEDVLRQRETWNPRPAWNSREATSGVGGEDMEGALAMLPASAVPSADTRKDTVIRMRQDCSHSTVFTKAGKWATTNAR